MKVLDLNLLTALDTLLTTQSVTLAAQRLHLSTPAMSHTLARIREALGDPILVRAGRNLVPTPKALALREPVRRLVQEATSLLRPMDEQQMSALRRVFKVRAPDSIAVMFGAAISTALRSRMPHAALHFVTESDDFLPLREGSLDLDIGFPQDALPEICSEPLYTQRTVGAARKDHRLWQAPIDAQRFSEQRHVAVTRRNQVNGPVDLALAELGLARTIALTVPSSYGALMAAARSDLVACVSERVAQSLGEPLGLAVFELPFSLPSEQVVQAWHPRNDADPVHQWLRCSVRQAFEKAVEVAVSQLPVIPPGRPLRLP